MRTDYKSVTTMTFHELAVGDVFRFESEVEHPDWGMERGPWRKISARKYEFAEDPDYHHQVGTWRVRVVRPSR